MKIKTGIKLKVNPEQSLHIQSVCFDNGIYWSDMRRSIQRIDCAYLFIGEHIQFMYTEECEDFEQDEFEQIDPELFIRTEGTCVEEEIKNKEEEEIVENIKEEKVYKNAKEYLVEKGLYEKVIHNCLKYNDFGSYFGTPFTWDKTKEGWSFWNKVDMELKIVGVHTKIDEILWDVASATASESIIPTLKPEDIPFLMEGLEPPKEEPEQPKQYLVYVEGKQAPKKVHNSLKSAQKEANRLAKREVGYVTYVVEIVNKYKATVSVEEIK